jgi:16S rRNA (uracil1498-N3)-methyltransferase
LSKSADFITFSLMELNRFYCPLISAPVSELTGPEAHHLTGVLRLGKNDRVELFDGAGKLAAAVVQSTGGDKVTLAVENIEYVQPRQGGRIIIAASIAKAGRFDWLITKCTELGVDRVIPVIFERTVKQPKNSKIVNRWTNLAISAAKQCRRLFLPVIDKPRPLPDALALLKKDYPAARFLFGSPSPDCLPLVNHPFGTDDVIAFIGPEGGLTDEETTFLRNNGAVAVRLTDTVLRIETAAIAFASILAAQRDVFYIGF